MGTSYEVICKRCGTRYTASFGPGMLFELLHCDRCGKEKSVGRGDLAGVRFEDRYIGGPKGICRCGGTFRLDAPPRCPKCRSNEYDVDPCGIVIDYD